MTARSIELPIMLGAAQIILRQASHTFFNDNGVSEPDRKLFMQLAPWDRDKKVVVTRTLERVCFGLCDVMGIPRFQLPAEYVAAVIFLCVSPQNYHPACSWAERSVDSRPATDLAEQQDFGPCSASQLFGLLVLVHGDDISNTQFPALFHKACKLAPAIDEEDHKDA